MTGFASAQTRTASGELVVELRSVNHRHLELLFKLPDELRALEPQLRERLTSAIKRGKLDVSIRIRLENEAAVRAPEINVELLDALFAQCENGWPDHELGSLAEWMRVPGVLKAAQSDTEKLSAAALACFSKALAELKDARLREGGKTRDVIDERVRSLSKSIEELESQLPSMKAAVIQRIRARLTDVGLEVDAGRFEQELVIQLQRSDVDEEIERLKLHIVELKRLLTSAEPVGRRLDFLLQELNREANTLGSKAQDIRSTNVAVDLKVLLEQIREQIQNLE